MKNFVVLSVFALSLIFAAQNAFSSAVSEPSNERQPLVLGMIIMEGKGFRHLSSALSVNGTTREGIEVTIQEIHTGGFHTMISNTEGVFSSVNVPEGEYRLARVFLKLKSGRSWISIAWNPPPDRVIYRFEVADGKVNNFGEIYWECESGEKNTLNVNQDYEKVRNWFNDKNNSSKWNQREWVPIGVRSIAVN